MADTQRLGQFEHGDNGGIALPALKAAQILLAEPGRGLDLLLRQAALAPNACKILTHKLAHIHVDLLAEYAL